MIIKGVPFIIKYFSKKANAIIERKGIIDDTCKEWVAKTTQLPCFSYHDITATENTVENPSGETQYRKVSNGFYSVQFTKKQKDNNNE